MRLIGNTVTAVNFGAAVGEDIFLRPIQLMLCENFCVVHIFDRLHLEAQIHKMCPFNSTALTFEVFHLTKLNAFFIRFFCSGGPISGGSQRTFWGLGKHEAVSVVGLGDGKKDWDALEKINGEKENVRIAAAGKLTQTFFRIYKITYK